MPWKETDVMKLKREFILKSFLSIIALNVRGNIKINEYQGKCLNKEVEDANIQCIIESAMFASAGNNT